MSRSTFAVKEGNVSREITAFDASGVGSVYYNHVAMEGFGGKTRLVGGRRIDLALPPVQVPAPSFKVDGFSASN